MQETATGALSQVERSYPTSKARGGSWEKPPHVQGQCHPTLKVRKGGGRRYPSSRVRSSREEIPHAQGKRNPSKMVGVVRGHQRADTVKPYSQKTSQSNHTRTTALSNSMKLSHAMWGHPRWRGHGGEV